MNGEDDLIQLYWEAVPERITSATELWIAYEKGDSPDLEALRRLLHSVKGEAQMFGLDVTGDLAEAAERLVDRIRAAGAAPEGAGNALLSSLEAVSAQIPGVVDEATAAAVAADALALLEQATSEVEASSENAAAPVASSDQGRAELDRQAVSVNKLEPVVSELRRLYSRQSLLYPQLSELRKMLRALLREIDPNASPERLSETIVKTLGFGEEIEKQLTRAMTEWSTTEYIANATLDQLSDLVRAAAVVPLSKLELTVNRIARGVAGALSKKVRVEVRGDPLIDGEIERRMQPVLLHLVRNAVDHGIEFPAEREASGKNGTGTIEVQIHTAGDLVRIEVRDDGRGVDLAAVRSRLADTDPDAQSLSDEDVTRVLFRHGFTTRKTVTPVSGRGVGLDVVYEQVVASGGTVRLESVSGEGTRFYITLPASTRVDTVLPLKSGVIRAAVPSTVVRFAGRLTDLVETPQGLQTRIVRFAENERVPVCSLSTLLGQPRKVELGDVVVGIETARGAIALTVDSYETPRPLVTQPVDAELAKSQLVQSVAPTPDGEVLLLLDLVSLYDHVTRQSPVARAEADGLRAKHVLVVEDATVARGLLVSMLSSFGYRVTEAMDGALGLDVALADPPDLILTDLEMPVMDGFQLVDRLRASPLLSSVPIVVLSTRDDPSTLEWSRRNGIARFLPKRRFEERKLRQVMEELLG
ncbi:MAG: ATP-binding protein [Myxococcota bacterium]